MADFLKKTFELLVGTDEIVLPAIRLQKKRSTFMKPTRRQLIQMESEIGGTLFGEVPKGHRREFFNLDAQTWIWHEEWRDQAGKYRSATTRYEVHDTGILKAQEGARYSFLDGEELENFILSTRLYYERVARDIYQRDPDTGQSLAARATA